MADWNHTVILHEPRKLLGITVLEYTVLDVIYKSQTSPIYSVNGWSKNGCHQLAKFMGCSPATVLAILERMEVLGYLLVNDMDRQLKKTTEAFYSVAYEKDKDNLSTKQGCSKTERVQKLNAHRSETERASVRKLNGKCSETEHKGNLNEFFLSKDKEKEFVESNSTPILDANEIEDIEQQIYYSKATQKKERKSSAKKKEKPDNPAPITPMFEVYAAKFAELTGQQPVFMTKYAKPLKDLYHILEARSLEKCIVPLDKLQPWKDFVEMWGNYLKTNQKETWHRDNFNPMTFYSQFNSIIAKLQNRPQTDAEKWVEWMKKYNIA